jgi:membrane protease YdiL (CAAX protease family)
MAALFSGVNHAFTVVKSVLRDRHLLRGMVYFAAGAAVFQTVTPLFPRRQKASFDGLHVAVLPLTLAVTRAFAELQPGDKARWQTRPGASDAQHLALGMLMGGAAILSTLGIARAKGWLSAPEWGTAHVRQAALARSMLLISIEHLAVATNEEIVFRGYGYTTLRRALPTPIAGACVTTLFALFHPLRPNVLIGESALGLALLALRVSSDGVWMPLGYHWMWNTLQGAVFGPDDGPPSLRPLHIHGPSAWVGRPGYPEPGILSTAVNASLAIIIWALHATRRNPLLS